MPGYVDVGATFGVGVAVGDVILDCARGVPPPILDKMLTLMGRRTSPDTPVSPDVYEELFQNCMMRHRNNINKCQIYRDIPKFEDI